MEEVKLKAYKTLIYQAFIDICVIASELAFKNDITEKTSKKYLEIFHISNAFHNLVLSLSEEPLEINEDDFWSRISFINNEFPSTKNYEKLFKMNLEDYPRRGYFR
ncbi:hypothetical protein [Paenibacillus alvei]|uniref:hypothetical protein n=1 Tax=Paenibacillus alvei TaxID=44250 RepID=UPI000386127C|nr:hypothetical protein [Paenibacillus alvei]EPY12120.1 hypothetical protein PAAL66ix_14521 [Paenibacillus alvei A6-6i-x]